MPWSSDACAMMGARIPCCPKGFTARCHLTLMLVYVGIEGLKAAGRIPFFVSFACALRWLRFLLIGILLQKTNATVRVSQPDEPSDRAAWRC